MHGASREADESRLGEGPAGEPAEDVEENVVREADAVGVVNDVRIVHLSPAGPRPNSKPAADVFDRIPILLPINRFPILLPIRVRTRRSGIKKREYRICFCTLRL